MREGLENDRQITLISAPAGFGKTTCVAEWVIGLEGISVSWLSLDPLDDDPVRFFSYLVAALQKVKDDFGLELEGMLQAGQLPSAEVVSIFLVNEILELNRRVALVLDDFHVIQDPFILKVFEQLITNLPRRLQLILVSREDPPLPLAYLRANNLLTEIRASDLQFSIDDTSRFLKEVMGLALSEKDIRKLEAKTEGWIAGLQLAGLSIRDRDDPSVYISSLSGTHRHILSYLTEEVLNRQPESIRHFLLQTSILDRLNGDLCNAITERTDSQVLLEQLFKANLFLVPLDDEGRWYRYHHLFADLLRNLQNSFQPNDLKRLHQRASQWYALAGIVSEAIMHAINAGDFSNAVELLEGHAIQMIMQGYPKTVQKWVQALPEEWDAHRPRTYLAFAWSHILRGDYSQAAEYLERIKIPISEEYQSGGDSTIFAEWLIMQSLMLYMHGKTQECMEMASRGLELTSLKDSRVRSMGYYVQASVYQLREQFNQAVDTYKLSIQHGKQADNLVFELMSTVGLAGMLLEQGQLHMAYEVASQAVERIERSGRFPPIAAVVYAVLGDTHYQWYQLEEARRNILRAMELSKLGGSNTVTIFSRVFLARQYLIEGDLESARAEIQIAADHMPLEMPEYTRQIITAQQVQIHLACDHPAGAWLVLQEQGFSFDDNFLYPDFDPGMGISYSAGLLYNSGLRMVLYQVRAGSGLDILDTVLALANDLIEAASKSKQIFIMIETLLLRAQMFAILGDNLSSQADYLRALEMAESENFIGVFVEGGKYVGIALDELARQNKLGTLKPSYVDRILAAFARSFQPQGGQVSSVQGQDKPVNALIEPLTEREVEVLRLMAKGLKYKEMAARLYISHNTVRYHVKAIYRKLNVDNRIKAIEIARQLQVV